jgi:hypothetical protein
MPQTEPDDLEPRLRILEAGLVRLETTVNLFVEESRALVPRIQTLLEARSGERAEAALSRRDIDRAHEKIRAIEARQDRMDERQNRLFWMATGAVAALQLLFFVLSWIFDNRSILGGP